MAQRYHIILSVLVFGAFASGIGGALAGGALRIPARAASGPGDTLLMGSEQVFRGSAPAYPVWPPEPLYPRAERVLREASYDYAPPEREVRVFREPEDLPPPYEVWMDGEERPVREDRRGDDWRGQDSRDDRRRRDDGRRDIRQEPPRVEVYRPERPLPERPLPQRPRREPMPPDYRGPPPGYGGPPPGYGPPPPPYRPPPPPPGYYGPPPRG